MAEVTNQSKIDAAAEKAYAEAAAKKTTGEKVAEAVKADAPATKAEPKVVSEAVAAPAPTPAKAPAKAAAPAKKAPAAKSATAKKVPAAKTAPATAKAPAKAPAKTTAKTTAARKAPAKKPTPAKKAAPAKVVAKTTETTTNPLTKLKETIMATAEKTDLTAQAKDFAADMQERIKTAYAKTGEFAGEFGEFNKANVEAVVESGKIFFAGAQELVKDNVETGKTVVETVTEDAKKLVAVKSPTELMQLQGELARRNFDAIVNYGSKRTEAWVKLYNDAFAPISNRVSVATEKMTKAA